MATLHQYYETDFSNAIRMHVRFTIEGEKIEAAILYDFISLMAYVACYVPENNRELKFFLNLLKTLEYGKTQMILDGKITLPAAMQFPGQLRFKEEDGLEIIARFHGDPTWVSSKNIGVTRRVFIFCDTDLSDKDIQVIKEEGKKNGHDIQIRSVEYMNTRIKQEKPLGFICHDSREKNIARHIAINLQNMLCPVWYDEFSLKIGDNLRESIEKGLRECKKCILILSPNFLSNNGWTNKEFDSIFTREILEEKNLVLPVWYNVSKDQVYEYSPSLLNVYGANWEDLGEEEVCKKLYRVILQ